MKIDKTIYWVSTALLCALMAFSASMYFTDTENIKAAFVGWNYPAYIVIPLAIAKVLGIIAILTKQSQLLKEWAYAGFFFDVILAGAAHLQAGDGEHIGAVIGLVLVIVSRIYDSKVFVYH